IPLGIMGSHTASFNLDVRLRAGDVLFIEFHSAIELLKFSPDRRHHEMPTGKTNVGMSSVELPTHLSLLSTSCCNKGLVSKGFVYLENIVALRIIVYATIK